MCEIVLLNIILSYLILICMYVSVGGLPSSAMGTAELLPKFDSVFDCINSSTVHSTKKLKCAINEKTTHISFLQEAIAFIKELKVFDGNEEVTGRIKCLKGWLVTLKAIISIWDQLKTTHEFKFLFTRRLNTDPLENFFGTIRQQGGNSDTPTPVQFTRAFTKLFFSSLLTSSSGNCAEDLDVLLAEFSNTTTGTTSDATPLVTPTPQPPTLTIGPTDYREQNVNSNIIKENAIAYVSGYLLNKCFKIHSCSKCTETLASNDLDDNRKLLCYFKAYSQENGC